MKVKHLIFWLILCWGIPTQVLAQRFMVEHFRVMPNDITASIHPVEDLNGEACALIKVVGSRDFAFSTPLGIVERRDEVGEIWLYVPHGTRFLTIKHPKWGVLRDYCLDEAVKPFLTYELVLEEPLPSVGQTVVPFPRMRPVGFVCSAAMPDYLETVPWQARRAKEPWRLFVLASAGMAKGVSPGLRVGVMRRHGVYVYGQSNFRSVSKVVGTCDEEGYDDRGTLPYYTGKDTDARYMCMAGGVHCLWRDWYVYEGMGYGERTLAWQVSEGGYLQNRAYSAEGLAAELGMMFRWRGGMLAVGVSTIATDWWEVNIGIGFNI